MCCQLTSSQLRENIPGVFTSWIKTGHTGPWKWWKDGTIKTFLSISHWEIKALNKKCCIPINQWSIETVNQLMNLINRSFASLVISIEWPAALNITDEIYFQGSVMRFQILLFLSAQSVRSIQCCLLVQNKCTLIEWDHNNSPTKWPCQTLSLNVNAALASTAQCAEY